MTLCQAHTRAELGGGELVTSPQADVPCPVGLIDALAMMTEGRQQGIQTGLGGVGLPTAVKNLHSVVGDLSDQVAMEIHRGDAIGVDHLGVCVLPILASGDGAVHQGFNLTHGRCRLVDFYTIHGLGHSTTGCVPLVSLVGKHALMGIQHEVNHLIGRRHVEAVAEPVHAHLRGCHGVKHEILEFSQAVCHQVGFVHVSTIHHLGCCAMLL